MEGLRRHGKCLNVLSSELFERLEMKQNKVEKRRLFLYFLIAFSFTWLFWIPKAIASHGLLAPSILIDFLFSPFNPAAFGPLVSAFSFTYLDAGKQGVIELLRRGVNYRIRKVWYIPTIFLFPTITGVALLLSILSGEATPDLSVLSNPLSIAGGFLYIFFLGGPLEEEFGWRGYALDRLQVRYNAFTSSIILGFMWGAWHLPLFFIPGTYPYCLIPIWGFMLSIMLGAILFTWLYNNTGGSILAAMLFHTMSNLSHFMFPSLETELGGLYSLILTFIAVILVLTIWGPKRMVRKTARRSKDSAY
ncbi:MAG: type II CAAX endopeptidase family protein [Candidatus Bathyarchaeia archaeon]